MGAGSTDSGSGGASAPGSGPGPGESGRGDPGRSVAGDGGCDGLKLKERGVLGASGGVLGGDWNIGGTRSAGGSGGGQISVSSLSSELL